MLGGEVVRKVEGVGLVWIIPNLEFINDYQYKQQNPSKDAGISCSLPGWQIEQRLCHII